ncbi:MAG TPA: SET domain-containing protein-lysine N-methyltransferase [Albitalea sp.]|nr:SET domain-containing protein-lysine N-methyltransferase [Albitalea sp.]
MLDDLRALSPVLDRSCPHGATLDELLVRDSHVHGLGAFARCGMPPAHCVGRYEGRRLRPGDALAEPVDATFTYLFGLSDGSLIDGGDGGNATRHINHSCTPNCQACEEADEDGVLHIVIRTRRRIRAGEELFIDYRLDVGDADPGDYPCRCGSPRCRGTLAATGRR